MRRTLTVTLVAAALLLGNAALVAADFCLATGVNTLVLKAFTLPGRGACKETRGFYPPGGDFGPPTFWVAGLACGSTNGVSITFFHTGIDDPGQVAFTDKFVLNRASASGSGQECLLETGSGTGCIPVTWTKIPCSPSTVPVP
jgi:hypothetical protein